MSRISTNTVLLVISNIGSAALLFLLTALIGRAFGAEGLGIYALIVAWTAPVGLLVEFGLGTLITRELARDPAQTSRLLRQAAHARLIFGSAGMVVIVLCAPLVSDDVRVVVGLQLSAPLVMLTPMFSLFTAVFRARESMLPIPLLNIGMVVVQIALTLVALMNGGGLLGIVLANVVSSAVQAAAAYAVYRRWYFTPESPGTAALGALLRQSWPFALAALFAVLQIRLSTLLLERLTTTSDVGMYFAASRFIEAGRLIPNAFFGALFPALAGLASHPVRFRSAFRRIQLGLGGFGVAGAAALTLTAPLLIEYAFGDGFQPAAIVLQILAWSLVAGLVRGGRTLYWYALGREKRVNAINAAAILLQILLSLWWVPAFGAVGAAWVQVIVEGAAFIALMAARPGARRVPA
ncbi:MAG: oligosaccharide flippase family protein [bacterium]|nr:oligosaccharide flippase family protein [bacterium]